MIEHIGFNDGLRAMGMEERLIVAAYMRILIESGRIRTEMAL